ncbi:hypothetical protein [Salinicola peritrichatus]|uniref:hypothetical protein n=1 Tax=Salinicola peritrichatus TaxID=1267424 RepID=UPI0013A68030|nr:hypothetical protein [Salinicola peritrichatus]
MNTGSFVHVAAATKRCLPNSCLDWDEITCMECGEFLTTCGSHTDRHEVSYPIQVLNMACGMILKTVHTGRKPNEPSFSDKALT